MTTDAKPLLQMRSTKKQNQIKNRATTEIALQPTVKEKLSATLRGMPKDQLEMKGGRKKREKKLRRVSALTTEQHERKKEMDRKSRARQKERMGELAFRKRHADLEKARRAKLKAKGISVKRAARKSRPRLAELSEEQREKRKESNRLAKQRQKEKLGPEAYKAVRRNQRQKSLAKKKELGQNGRAALSQEQLMKRKEIEKKSYEKRKIAILEAGGVTGRAALSKEAHERRKQIDKMSRERKMERMDEQQIRAFHEKKRQYAREYRAKMTPEQKKLLQMARRPYMRKLWQTSQNFRNSDSAWRKKETVCIFCKAKLKKGSMPGHRKMHEKYAARLLPLTQEQRDQIEVDTREGSMSSNWHKARQGMITATRAHRIITNVSASKQKIAQNMTHCSTDKRFTSKPMQYGIDKEKLALSRYREAAGIPENFFRDKCGFMIHKDHSNIGATPDGLILGGGTVEVKCPVVCAQEVATRKNAKFLMKSDGFRAGEYLHRTFSSVLPTDNILQLRRTHEYFTQVVLQVICTDSPYGVFVVYFEDKEDSKKYDVWAETITREEVDEYWPAFEEKLIVFYNNYVTNPSFMNMEKELKRGKFPQSVIEDFFKKCNVDSEDTPTSEKKNFLKDDVGKSTSQCSLEPLKNGNPLLILAGSNIVLSQVHEKISPLKGLDPPIEMQTSSNEIELVENLIDNESFMPVFDEYELMEVF